MQSKAGTDLFLIMDIGKIFECLEEDYRTFVVSIAMSFPMAYVDCWKLVPAFRNYEIFPQIMLSLGASIMFVFLGAFYITLIWMLTKREYPSSIRYHAFGLLLVFAFSSILVASGTLSCIATFMWVYVGLYVIIPLVCIIAAIKSPQE